MSQKPEHRSARPRFLATFPRSHVFAHRLIAPLALLSFFAAGPSQASPTVSSTSGKTNIAQAASAETRVKGIVHREWFRFSAPEIVPALNRAADQVDQHSSAAALNILEEIGRPNDPNVLNMMAMAILQSRTKDAIHRAFETHLKAANRGHPESMNEVGQYLRMGVLGRVDLAKAVDWYERGASAGSADAATNAGRAYYNGWLRPIDFYRAHRYYEQAALGGDAWGMQNYGLTFLDGRGTARDAETGREWVGRAAKKGLAEAQLSYAELARKGLGGPLDTPEFVRWARASADQGYAPALYELGMYFLGPEDNEPPDPARAANYLRQAAIKKHPAAQFAYATLCEQGVGADANPVQAFLYYSLALRSGQKKAQERLERLRASMTEEDLATARRLVSAAS